MTLALLDAEARETAADHANLRLWLRLLGCTVAIQKVLRRRLETRFATTLPRFDVLAALDRHGRGMALSALSRALLVSNGNVTGIVRKLVADGLVAVEPDARDRRVSIARLTPAGRAHFAEVSAAHHRWVEELTGDLPATLRDRLHEDLGVLKASLAATGARESGS